MVKRRTKSGLGRPISKSSTSLDQIARIFIRIDVVGVLVFDANLLNGDSETVWCDRSSEFVALATGSITAARRFANFKNPKCLAKEPF